MIGVCLGDEVASDIQHSRACIVAIPGSGRKPDSLTSLSTPQLILVRHFF